MATVERPTPGFFAAVLHELRSADPRTYGVVSALRDFLSALTTAEAEQLPHAVAGVLSLLRGDMERLRFAADVLVRFDLFEAAGELATVAIGSSDRELMLAAAALCGNPGAEQAVRNRVSDALGDDPAGRIRLDGDFRPHAEDEMLLHWQCWPGSRPARGMHPLAPVVVLDRTLDAAAMLRLAARLDGAGASVRRLAPQRPIPKWFGPQTVAVCHPTTRQRILSQYPDVPEAQILWSRPFDKERDQAALLRRINSELPAVCRLRLATLGPELSISHWDPDVYGLGVYETREAAFLSGASTAIFYRLSRQELLHPRRREPVTVWGFSDLVAVRTLCYLRSQTRRRVSNKVVSALAGFAGDADATRIGVTEDGHVLVDSGGGWVDLQTEQLVFDRVVEVDEAFREFQIGGRRIPDLLHASDNTRLNPAVLHGTPYLKDHRIPARALAELDRRNGLQAIHAAYPELTNADLEGTVAIGRQLIDAR